MWFRMLGGTFLHVECATDTRLPSPDRLSLMGRGRAVVDTSGCDVYLAVRMQRAPPFLGGPILIRKSSLMAVVASDDVVYLASV